jgi:hypothetical protein
MSGVDVASAKAAFDMTTHTWRVDVTFATSAAARWEQVLASNTGHRIAILVDGSVVVSPVVNYGVTGRDLAIEGLYTETNARRVAAELTPRSLPIPTTATCPGPPTTFARGGQAVVPVSVPCFCPTAAITVPPAGADARAKAARAALWWVRRVKHWAPGAGRVTAIYKVGDTSPGVWGSVFAQNVPEFCGQAVTTASWVIELGNDHIVDDTGRDGAVVVAHFAVGWQVWGVYR